MDLRYSDYIIYADESGDHSLKSIDKNYPIFVLSFCVFQKDYYSSYVTPALRKLKFATFGHDMVILHEYDIRKKMGAFKRLGKEQRETFLEALNVLVAQTDFTLIAMIMDKYKLGRQDAKEAHIYHLAMQLGLEKLYTFLQSHGQDDRLTHIICESRGKKEDLALEIEFRRTCDGDNSLKKSLPFELILADKRTNSEGLQFADMAARPVGLSALYPGQSNRAFKILEKKFYRSIDGEALGHGFHLHP